MSVDMSVLRKNTLVVDFSVLPKRPDAGKVQEFLEKKVKLQLADTTNIQLHNLRNCVYIETIDSETALRYERANHNKHAIVCGGKEFKIPVYVESEAVTVRVHDLPPHTQHLTVINSMSEYGVVISITRERWKYHFPGIYNGVRVLRMKLSRPIPSCVTIDGETTLVTYRNQPKTCRHCGKAAHPKQKCAKTSKTATTPPNGSNGPEMNGDEFPPLSPTFAEEEPNVELDNDETKMQQNKNENNTTSDNGDNCDDGCDDDDDDDGNDSSDTNEFIEAANQKRRMSTRRLSEKAKGSSNEMKKMCLSQGCQNLDQNSNRFQALVEIDSMFPTEVEMEEYLKRSKNNKKCNSSI